jgi:hypothetical protein
MPIYYCEAKIISRSKGQSVVAHAAYVSRGKIKDRADNKTKDYHRKEGLIASGISTPKDVPGWANDREELWNKVQEKESQSKRWETAQLARSFVFALPYELTNEENIDLVRDIAKEMNNRGMIVDWAVHEPSEEGDQRNIHAHMITTMREITPEGFDKKRREWNDRQYLENMKIRFADIVNERLRERGLPLIDSRSCEKQNEEIENIAEWKVPQKHRGVIKTNIDRRLARIDRELERVGERLYGKYTRNGRYARGDDNGHSADEKRDSGVIEFAETANIRDEHETGKNEQTAERTSGQHEPETRRTIKKAENRNGGYSR